MGRKVESSDKKYQKLEQQYVNMEESADNAFRWLTVVMLCQYSLFDYFRAVIYKIPVVSSLDQMFFPVVIVTLFCFSIKRERFKYLWVNDLFFIIVLAIAFLDTFIRFPENKRYIIADWNGTLIYAIPFYLLGLMIELDRRTVDWVGNFSCVAVAVSTVYVFYYMASGRQMSVDSMYWSYCVLPNTLIALLYGYRKEKKYSWIFYAMGVFYAFSMGTRGPIVIIAAYTVACIWVFSNSQKWAKYLIASIIFVTALYIYNTPLFTDLLTAISKVLSDLGFSTRVIDKIISNEVAVSKGRDNIYTILIPMLNMFGHGIYGEWTLGFHAAHNMYLEILFHWGLIIGPIIIAVIFSVFFKGLQATRNRFDFMWVMLWGFFVFIRGVFGGGYLNYPTFFLMGTCLRMQRQRLDPVR